MTTNIFDMQEMLLTAWEGFKKNAVLLVVLPLALVIVSVLIYSFSLVMTMLLPFLFFLLPIIILIEVALYVYVSFCMITASLAILRGETPSWEILKIDVPSFVRFSVVFLVIAIAVAIPSAVISFAFPAILGVNAFSFMLVTLFVTVVSVAAATFFFPAPYMIIDKKDVSMIDAVKNSWNLTFPSAVPCFIFILACFVINFIGSIPFGLGLIVTMPVTLISAAQVYKKLDAAPAATAVTAATEQTDAANK